MLQSDLESIGQRALLGLEDSAAHCSSQRDVLGLKVLLIRPQLDRSTATGSPHATG